jgi:hypothetical protein
MEFDIKLQCARLSSSCLDHSVINRVVLENGRFEPVAKLGSKVAVTTHLDQTPLPI